MNVVCKPARHLGAGSPAWISCLLEFWPQTPHLETLIVDVLKRFLGSGTLPLHPDRSILHPSVKNAPVHFLHPFRSTVKTVKTVRTVKTVKTVTDCFTSLFWCQLSRRASVGAVFGACHLMVSVLFCVPSFFVVESLRGSKKKWAREKTNWGLKKLGRGNDAKTCPAGVRDPSV